MRHRGLSTKGEDEVLQDWSGVGGIFPKVQESRGQHKQTHDHKVATQEYKVIGLVKW